LLDQPLLPAKALLRLTSALRKVMISHHTNCTLPAESVKARQSEQWLVTILETGRRFIRENC